MAKLNAKQILGLIMIFIGPLAMMICMPKTNDILMTPIHLAYLMLPGLLITFLGAIIFERDIERKKD